MVLCYKPCLSLQSWSDHVISLPPRLLPEKTKKHLSSFGLHALMAWLQLRSAAKLPWRSCCIHSENVTSHGSRKVPRLCHPRPEVVNRCPHLSSLWLEMDQKSSHQIVWHQSPNVHDIFQLLTANSWFLSTSTNQLYNCIKRSPNPGKQPQMGIIYIRIGNEKIYHVKSVDRFFQREKKCVCCVHFTIAMSNFADG